MERALARGAREYDVHPSITVGTGTSDDLTQYVRREAVDDRLAAVVQAAVRGQSRLAVLVGGSSTGKTRACWEALRWLPTGWRVWQPRNARQLLSGLPASDQYTSSGPGARTIIWLDELQRYLPSQDEKLTEAVAVALRDLLADDDRMPILMLATIWPDDDRWGALVREPSLAQRDPHHQARKLLAGTAIRVPESIGDDIATARRVARTDLRWRLALEQDPKRPIQYLAGARYLLDRYVTASAPARAVLDAAGDASRVGAPQGLPMAFLEQAAQGYLETIELRRLPADRRVSWIRDAICDPGNGLVVGGRGVDGPLRELRTLHAASQDAGDVLYGLADSLEQHLRRERLMMQPRDTLWNAAIGTFTDPIALITLARAAEVRGRYLTAVQLYEGAAAAGSSEALRGMARRQEVAGYTAAAEQLLSQAAAAGDSQALYELAEQRAKAGKARDASQLMKRAADAGNNLALQSLARDLERGGQSDAAQRLLWRVADDGSIVTRTLLVSQMKKSGDIAGAVRLLRRAAEAGDSRAMLDLFWLLDEQGNTPDAERFLLRAVAADNRDAMEVLARRLEKRGDIAGSEDLLRKAAAAGNLSALHSLWWKKLKAGDTAGAEQLALQAAEVPTVLHSGGRPAIPPQNWLVFKPGWADDDWTREAAAAGNTDALNWLAQAGYREAARQIARHAAAFGHASALEWLTEIGDSGIAEQLAQQAASVGHPEALHWLARQRWRAGDTESAERLLNKALAAGDTRALRKLAELLDSASHTDAAENVRRFGITADRAPENPWPDLEL